MATRNAAAGALIAALLLAGCAAPTPAAEPEAPPSRAEVDWSAYPSNYQRIVDEETEEGDCEALQGMFDAAPNDPDLLGYLDEAMRLADCY
jgi:hypothetical protein